MNVEWIERGTKTPNHLRERAERHLGKLDRYSHGDSGARVVVTHEGAAGSALREVEVVLRNRLGVFAARDDSRDLVDALRRVLDRVETQARRAHDKLVDRGRGAAGAGAVTDAIARSSTADTDDG